MMSRCCSTLDRTSSCTTVLVVSSTRTVCSSFSSSSPFSISCHSMLMMFPAAGCQGETPDSVSEGLPLLVHLRKLLRWCPASHQVTPASKKKKITADDSTGLFVGQTSRNTAGCHASWDPVGASQSGLWLVSNVSDIAEYCWIFSHKRKSDTTMEGSRSTFHHWSCVDCLLFKFNKLWLSN